MPPGARRHGGWTPDRHDFPRTGRPVHEPPGPRRVSGETVTKKDFAAAIQGPLAEAKALGLRGSAVAERAADAVLATKMQRQAIERVRGAYERFKREKWGEQT